MFWAAPLPPQIAALPSPGDGGLPPAAAAGPAVWVIQPMQVVGAVWPTAAAVAAGAAAAAPGVGASTGSGFASLARSAAGLALGGGAAWGSGYGAGAAAAGSRQRRQQQQQQQEERDEEQEQEQQLQQQWHEWRQQQQDQQEQQHWQQLQEQFQEQQQQQDWHSQHQPPNDWMSVTGRSYRQGSGPAKGAHKAAARSVGRQGTATAPRIVWDDESDTYISSDEAAVAVVDADDDAWFGEPDGTTGTPADTSTFCSGLGGAALADPSIAIRTHGGADEGGAEEAACQELLAQLDLGGEDQSRALATLFNDNGALRLAFTTAGCHVVQRALEVASRPDAEALAAQFRNHVREAIDDKNANYVVQKFVELLPASSLDFVFEEFKGVVAEVARHRYGCRIICRLLEHFATDPTMVDLITELLAESGNLARHLFGYHVMRALLEHGLPEHRRRVVTEALSGREVRAAKHRQASFVVEKALAFCDADSRDALAGGLVSKPGSVIALAKHQFGRHVVRELLRLPRESPPAQAARTELQHAATHLRATKHGRRCIEELKPSLGATSSVAVVAAS